MRRCRNRVRAAAALLGAALAAGCAGGGDDAFDARMAGFIGRGEGELVAALGVPDLAYPLADGARVLRYDHAAAMPGLTTAGVGFGLGFGSFGGGFGIGTGLGFGLGGYDAPPALVGCSANFLLRGGRVTEYRRQGADCPPPPG